VPYHYTPVEGKTQSREEAGSGQYLQKQYLPVSDVAELHPKRYTKERRKYWKISLPMQAHSIP